MILLFLLFFAYVIGSIPTGWLISRSLGIRDIKTVGSGNIGATNVARICGWQWFLVVFLLDGSKAYFCLLFSALFTSSFYELLLIAFALLLGNTCSLFLQFRGGKGVATFLGLLLFLQPIYTLILIAAWLVFLLLFKAVGIASVGMVLLFPAICIFNGCSAGLLLFSVGVAGWIVWLHKRNIFQFLS